MSQASTAARWLLRTLENDANLPATYEAVRRQYTSMPHVIIETHPPSTGVTCPTRRLVALDELASTAHFWTIDARVVDYLGVISRDLGRELSYGEFLSGIAPDLHDQTITPVVPDAYHYRNHILMTHFPEVVRFSKRHQQTIVKWIPRVDPALVISLEKTEYEAIRQKIPIDELMRYETTSRDIGFHNPFEVDDVLIAKLEGDMEEVKGVRTRVAVILKPESDWANLWSRLRTTVFKLRGNVPLSSFATIWIVAEVVHIMFLEAGSQDRYPRQSQLPLIWKDLIEEVDNSPALKAANLQLPTDIRDLKGESGQWFDATRYWLNWDR